MPAMVDVGSVSCFVVAAVLVVGGTLATGVFPPTLPYQILAGGIIVSGFALVFLCLADDPMAWFDTT